MASWIIGNSAVSAWLAGNGWDEALADLDEARASATDLAEQERMLIVGCLLRVARGDPADAALPVLEDAARRLSDPLVAAGLDAFVSDRAFLRRDYGEAFQAMMRAAELPSMVAPYYLASAVRPALWMGDVEGARMAADSLDALASSGSPLVRADRTAIRAGIAALEGSNGAAVSGFLDAIRQYRALGVDFPRALAGLDFVRLVGPGIPEALAAAEESRVIFERVGARPYLAWLDEAVLGTGRPMAQHAEATPVSSSY